MEIQKIYSDPYEERLYSVLMDEDEIRMFTGAVKRANKLAKKAWEMKAGEKDLMDRGYKKYVSTKNYRTELAPEFRDTKDLLKRGREELHRRRPDGDYYRKYREASINDRINAKADEYYYPRGKVVRMGANPHPRAYFLPKKSNSPLEKLSDNYIHIGRGI